MCLSSPTWTALTCVLRTLLHPNAFPITLVHFIAEVCALDMFLESLGQGEALSTDLALVFSLSQMEDSEVMIEVSFFGKSLSTYFAVKILSGQVDGIGVQRQLF